MKAPSSVFAFRILIAFIMCAWLISFFACGPEPGDLRAHLKGWEMSTTYKIRRSAAVQIEEKLARIVNGAHDVLTIRTIRKPIYKESQHLADMHSARTLYIELSVSDTLITPASLGKSRLLRELIAFTPNHGVHALDSSENIRVVRFGEGRLSVKSLLEDFNLECTFDLTDTTTITAITRSFYD